jgi:hypothetical protein
MTGKDTASKASAQDNARSPKQRSSRPGAPDDVLGEFTASNATVRAAPLVQQRGVLTNLLIFFASNSAIEACGPPATSAVDSR